MRHLIIAAHPGVKSFNHAVVEAYTAALTKRGHRVAYRDLYATGFKPVLSAHDMAAMARGKAARDVRTKLNVIRAADVITMPSPSQIGSIFHVCAHFLRFARQHRISG